MYRYYGGSLDTDAAEALAATLEPLPEALGFAWASRPAKRPLAFGLFVVAATAVLPGDSDPEALRDDLGRAIGATEDDDAATSSSSDDDDDDDEDDAPVPRVLACAWPEIAAVRYGEQRRS